MSIFICQYGLYRSVVFLWVQGGVRIMAARDNLLVMCITVTLLVVTLQKKLTKTKRSIIVLIESVYVSMCVGEGVGGMEEYSSPLSVLCYKL